MKRYSKLLTALALAMACGTAIAQSYPAKAVRIVVGYPPGGPTDVLARIVAQKLTESWGQQVLVDNRPGASGMIGAEVTVRAIPDGYTLLMVPVTYAVTPSLYPKMSYDAVKDLAPVAQVAAAPFILVVHPTLPVKTVKDLITLARSRPAQLNYASASAGGMPHLAGELFNTMTGVKMVHIPYKGAAPATTDLLAGQVSLMFNNMLSAMPQVKNGRLRAIAVTSTKRSAAAPELPTIAETVPGYEASGWYAALAPAATPRELITRLNNDMNRVMKMPDVTQRLAGDGVEAVGITAEQFGAYLRSEITKWGKVVQTSGAKAD
ncbi:MAG: tripartite tricarboxylate transporter substrate binding protein [Burkholderiales bacterium]|jgi:tripartite-type tricarboxylate transporter receptor subunit TctC|nr:tripartite tricarboxylate transporter substrate binding protein [Burkholderiales bacterium]